MRSVISSDRQYPRFEMHVGDFNVTSIRHRKLRATYEEAIPEKMEVPEAEAAG